MCCKVNLAAQMRTFTREWESIANWNEMRATTDANAR